jgi:fatty-acyl-CoA synthase
MEIAVTMGSWVAGHAARTPDKVALICKGERVTYAALDERARACAAGLRELGVRQGDRVAVLLLNSVELLEVLLACTHLGAIFVPLNFRLSQDEIAFILGDATPELLIFHQAFALVVEHARARTRVPAWVQVDGPPADGVLAYAALRAGAGAALRPEAVGADAPALMMYTSGTTGRPKGALLSHANLLWNNIQMLLAVPARDDDINYNAAPFFHIGGLNVLTGPLLYRGATTIIDDKFEPQRALQAIARERATCAFMVPAMWAALAQVEAFDRHDLSSLRYALVGGAPCPLPVLEFYAARGITFREGFGLTETAPVVCLLSAADGIRKSGSVGHPAAHVQVRIVDDADRDVPEGEPGELIVRAPNLMIGYWNRPEETAAALRGGWFHTGDLARRDAEGFIYIVDRKKDMVITGGENVYPVEVEQVLFRHPAIADVAVVGVPDARWGEALIAVVVLRQGAAAPGLDELRAFCEGKLAHYKQPRGVRVVEALPRNATGKVLKQELRLLCGGTASAVTR